MPSNQPPQFAQSSFVFNMRENKSKWQTPKNKLKATDADGPDNAITYSLSGDNPVCAGCGNLNNPDYYNSLFRVANNSNITYQGDGEDYESFAAGQAKYELVLTATDSEGSNSSVTVTINIKDVAD